MKAQEPELAGRSRFGALLKLYRQAARLSQEALAERASLSVRAISDLERGINQAPRNATFEALATGLGLSAPQRDLLLAAARPDLVPATAAFPSAPRVSLPVPPTRLIGRENEYTQALGLLREGETRLLTLTGPSGVGKTRLALELAHGLAASFEDGLVYASIAAIRDASLVPHAVAQALGIRGIGSSSPAEQVHDYLRDKHFLLALDNLEHVLDCAAFVSSLLANCPRLALLVTSRMPLHLRGEHELELLPLPLRDAVRLFSERAGAVRPDGDYPAGEVEAICEQLDRLPLAIELAARHIKVLAIPELRKRLDHRLELLRSGPRDLPARQQTMEDAIAWSYELLTEPQQKCFRSLGVFVGGWDLEAAEAVCAAEGQAARGDGAITLLAGLVDASLVHTEPMSKGHVRFSMLELIREFASSRLRAASEEAACRRRHAQYYARMADRAAALFGPVPDPLDVQVAADFPNARAALEWAAENQEAELGLRLTGFARLWYVTGHAGEAVQWLERMLTIDARAREQSAPAGPITLRIEKLNGLGRVLMGRGEIERAREFAQQALQLAEESGDLPSEGSIWATFGYIAQASGSLDQAAHAFTESLRCGEKAADYRVETQALTSLAELARLQGDTAGAKNLLEQALGLAKAHNETWNTAVVMTLLGHLARQQGALRTAQARYRAGLALLLEFGSPTYIAWGLEGLATVLSVDGPVEEAVHFLGAAANLRTRAGTPLPPSERAAVEQAVAALQEALGPANFEREWTVGTGLRMEDALAEALAGSDQDSPAVSHRRP